MRWIPLTILVGAFGCSRATELGPASAHVDVADVGPDAVERMTCGERPGCLVESRLALERRGDGSDLVAVVARLPRKPRLGTDRVVLEPRVRSTLEQVDCTPREVWLVASSAKGAERVQLLTTECATDPVAGPMLLEKLGAGELRCTVARRVENTDSWHPTYSQASEVSDFALDPPRLLRTQRRESVPNQPSEHGFFQARSRQWDWDAFRGRTCWRAQDECSEVVPTARIVDDGAFVGRDGWKTTSLGSCSLPVEGRSASVRLLLVDETLFVEVTDDAFVTRGTVVDAIEVVSSLEEATPANRPWVQRLTMDGTFTDHDGTTRRVEVAESGPNVRRFALKDLWLTPFRVWWLAYEDTDDGRSVAERLSSVPSASLNGQSVLDLEPTPRCEPRGSVLHPRPALAADRDASLL
jgi:hypothetical protein